MLKMNFKNINAGQIFILLALFSITLYSCSDNESTPVVKGNASFSFRHTDRDNSGGRTGEVATPAFMLLSIDHANGNKIVTDKKLALTTFGKSYISEDLELGVGVYKLTAFTILDRSGNTLYATPRGGSALAKYVVDPLPIDFIITENNTTNLSPQVLAIYNNDTPERFGYAGFGFEIVTIKKIKRLEHRDKFDSLRAYVTFEYDGKSRLIKKSIFDHQLSTSSSADYLSSMHIYEYSDNDLLKRVKKQQGDGSASEHVYYFTTDNKVSKIETYASGRLYTYFEFLHAGDTIKAQRFDANEKADWKRHEYIFANDNLIRYNRYQSNALEYYIDIEHDAMINPFDFGTPDFYVVMPPEELFFNFPSIRNPVKQSIVELSQSSSIIIDYQYSYDASGYPVKVVSNYWELSGGNWMRYGYWSIKY
jgi:hypothetical protein